MSRFQKNEEWDTMRQARIEIEIFPKTEEKETTPTGLWNMHRQESGKFDEKKKAKRKSIKWKPMYEHFIHA